MREGNEVVEVTQEMIGEGLAQYDAAVSWLRTQLVSAANESDVERYVEQASVALAALTDEELSMIAHGFGFLKDSVETVGQAIGIEALLRLWKGRE